MTPQEMADQLDGRQYPLEINEHEVRQLIMNGLVVVAGASDDLIIFGGAITDEGDCYDGGTFLIDNQGVLPDWEQVSDDEDEAEAYIKRKPHAKQIEAVWCGGEADWTYKTDIPHATFKIMEDGEVYCIGMVFDIKELAACTQ